MTVSDAVLCAVESGSLYNSLVQSFKHYGWDNVSVVAVENEGCAFCKNCLWKRSSSNYTTKCYYYFFSYRKCDAKNDCHVMNNVHNHRSLVVSQRLVAFARNHKMIIETACGAALTSVYNDKLCETLQHLTLNSIVVVIVCGGTAVTWILFQN